MRRRCLTRFLAILLMIIALAGCCMKLSAMSLEREVDLYVLLEASDAQEIKADDGAVRQCVKILKKRMRGLGFDDRTTIRRHGAKEIIIGIKKVNDPKKIVDILARRGIIEVKGETGATILTNKDVKKVRVYDFDSQYQGVPVVIEFTEQGGKIFADFTSENIGKYVAFIYDNDIFVNAVVKEPITGGKVILSCRTMEEAQRMQLVLRHGALPVEVDVLEVRILESDLGQDSQNI